MKDSKTNLETDNTNNSKKGRLTNIRLVLVLIFGLVLSTSVSFAHCDTMEGPLVQDAKKAIDQNNVNIVLKWVPRVNEAEIRNAFNQTVKVRILSAEAKDLAEKYFFETLVRIHRNAEGVSFTGVKPAGTPVDEKIKAADQSIAAGNLSPLKGLIAKADLPELKERFEKVMSLKNFNVNNVEAGRAFVEAYVHFFKFAEGEVEGHSATDRHGYTRTPAHNKAH